MPDSAIENVVAENVKAYLISGINRLNTSNCLLVPRFDQPPMHWTDIMCQIKFPDVYPYGHAGWTYGQKITIEIACFKRCSKDPKKRWDAVLTDLAEANLLIRQRLNGYTGGTGTAPIPNPPLTIPLFDSNQTMSPRVLQDDAGQIVKECLWVATRFWGTTFSSVDRFQANDYDGG